MIPEKEIIKFIKRINRYNEYTSEKEIETEFYKFISKYYEYKYTNNGEGVIDYTAPYNIDGLLEIRTLDTDYRILVEAKASKNFKNKVVRNEVLSQAVFYCRKLKKVDEMLPSVILLIEKSSMAIIYTNDIENFINESDITASASSAFKMDEVLIKSLNETDYNYTFINFKNFKDPKKYNSIFEDIDYKSIKSHYGNVKIKKSETVYLNIIKFISNYSIVKTKDDCFCLIDNKYQKTSLGILKQLLLKEINFRTIGKIEALQFFEELIDEKQINHIRCGSNIINMDNKNIEGNFPYKIDFENVLYEKIVGGYDYRVLSEYLFDDKHYDSDIIIYSKTNNNKFLEKILNKFNKPYEFGLSYLDKTKKVIIINDESELTRIFNISKKFKALDLTDFHTYGELINKLINSYRIFDYDRNGLLTDRVNEWNENSDPLLGFFKNNLEIVANHFVLVSDFADYYNKLLKERGQATVSMRTLVEEIKSHPFMMDNKGAVLYKNKSYIKKDMVHSPWADVDDENKDIRTPGAHPSYILGVRFKDIK